MKLKIVAYTTKVKLGHKRTVAAIRNRAGKQSRKSILKRLKLGRFKKLFYVAGGLLLMALTIGGIVAFAWLQQITENLPRPDKPFGAKDTASEIYDRNGKLLYRVFGDENRDPVKINDVPALVKWSYLAAEDVDFYEHPGVDIVAIARCGLRRLGAPGIQCGASTITQQLIKLTSIDQKTTAAVVRKVQEVILALQIEKLHSKDEILEMYLTVVPEGSNIYGLTQASKTYFNKDVKDLTLSEMTVLSAIVNNPTNLSPLIAGNDPTRLKDRQTYILDQMSKNMDKINANIKQQTGQENVLTQALIDEAKAAEYKFTLQGQRDQLKAPHFVFYVEKLLEQRGYNYGVPFTKENLETSGYKIYTTLDLDYQQIAEEQVNIAVDGRNRKLYGADNAALIALNPNNGEILAMVGSKDYFAPATPEGCSGASCRFSPRVNVLDTVQSVGSSLKPMFYYYAFEKGLITPGSITPDIPIKIRGYGPKGPKNFEGGYQGLITARAALSNSRNIPPIYMVDYLGVDNFVAEMKKWGYSSLNDPRGYGPSIVVGGADINLIEHAQAYGVLASGGKLAQNEAILKIIDKDGNVVYEAKPNPVQVADARAVYLVNDVLNAKKGGPGISFDGRDTAGKTGTSEGQKETLFATYTPEIVVLGWYGNNNNDSLKGDPSGFSSARPWISDFLKRVEGNIPKTPFNRPAGVVNGSNCSADEGASCDARGDLAISDIRAPSYLNVKNFTVCVDQTNRLARDIDISSGNSTVIAVKKYTMPNPAMQQYLDAYLGGKPELNGIIPTEYCDIPRNTPTPTPTATPVPVADTITITDPTNGQNISSGSQTVSFTTTGTVTNPKLSVNGGPSINCAANTCTWNATTGVKTLVISANGGVESNTVTVTVL